jgi:hypothetical protein
MQFEDFDSKVRQAAEQHHPNYDEKAWAKMEKLLNRYLPQKDNRRRIIFFLLLFLFLGGGVWMLISKPWQQSNRTLTTNTTRQLSPANEQAKKATTESSFTDKKQNAEPTAESPGNPSENLVAQNNKKDKEIVMQKQDRTKSIMTAKRLHDDSYNIILATPGIDSRKDQPGKAMNDDKIKSNNSSDRNVAASPADNNDAKKNDPARTQVELTKQADQDKAIAKDEATEQPKAVDQKDAVTKSHNKKRNTFFFSFSAAPDVSAVELNKPGKVKLLTGAGFGYTIKDRWTISTGFYTARKIYTASKEEYKPSSPIMNYNYLDKIDADCKVYEIPLDIAYDFDRSERHNLFASVGLSSYIMKKETYNSLYKWPNGQTASYSRTINNENKHYFSVLNLSAGYQYKINKTFSIGAEPYLKLPLSGLGYGKIKLNSTGVLFSVSVKPFKH